MSNEIIKMDYELMAEMKDEFQRGAEDLDDTLQQMLKIADMLEEGGLIGQGGDAFADALRSVLQSKIVTLRDKFEELGRDIQAAVNSMQDAEGDVSGFVGLR